MAPHWLLELSCSPLSLFHSSWLAAATQMREREPNVPPQDITPDALPAANPPNLRGLETDPQYAGLHAPRLDYTATKLSKINYRQTH